MPGFEGEEDRMTSPSRNWAPGEDNAMKKTTFRKTVAQKLTRNSDLIDLCRRDC